MKISVLRMILMGGLTLGSLLGANAVKAGPAVFQTDPETPQVAHLTRERVPEIPAKGLAAGTLLVLGGVAVIVGRRRRAR
jgi:hypothetical protein